MVLQDNNENLSVGGIEATYNAHRCTSRLQLQKNSKAQGNFSSSLLHKHENEGFPHCRDPRNWDTQTSWTFLFHIHHHQVCAGVFLKSFYLLLRGIIYVILVQCCQQSHSLKSGSREVLQK